MVIKPKIKSFICTTSHPKGCSQNVKEQINRIKSHTPIDHGNRIRNVLVIGGSMGYGLASRITSSFLLQAGTLNVCMERLPSKGRTASPGWYNTAAFEREAFNEGIYAKTVIGDAFSDEVKQKTIATIKTDLSKIDLVIYSLASPRRTDPKTGKTYTSVLKTVGELVTAKTINVSNGQLTEVKVDPATPEEIEATVKVMGGEDWLAWIQLLEDNNVLSDNYLTMAYSYIGPAVTQSIYRSGTIGKAKEDLERTASRITSASKIDGRAVVSINKALVTQASSAIPILPLYVSVLYKVMKSKNLHEDCLDQMLRLFMEKINYQNNILSPCVDENGMIRLDDWEMRFEIQKQVEEVWGKLKQDNVLDLIDFDGYQKDFLRLFGFGWEDIDYDVEVEENVEIMGVVS